MHRGRARRIALLAALSLIAAVAAPSPVSTAPPDKPRAEFLGACYCRSPGRLDCVAGITRAQCSTQCEEAFCHDWFWLERLPCWNWGYGG